MGKLVSKEAKAQVLICGPSKNGKTELLYSQLIDSDVRLNETQGFQYEEIGPPGQKEGDKVGFWDIGGTPAFMSVLQSVTQNVQFSALLMVIDISYDCLSFWNGTQCSQGGKGN